MPSLVRIENRQHPLVKQCRALAVAREGDKVLLDGEHLVLEAMRAGVHLQALLTDARPRPTLTSRADSRAVPRYEGTTTVLEAASPVRTPSGVVAIGTWSPHELAIVMSGDEPLLIGLVGVQDPGNVGGVIRTADALGASGVLVIDGSADPGGWKALRGAMGSTFRIPVARATLGDALALAHERHILVAAAVASGGLAIDAAPLAGAMLLLLGNEGGGLDEGALTRAGLRLTIPMRAGVDSLNVSVSAAVCLWQARLMRAAVKAPA